MRSPRRDARQALALLTVFWWILGTLGILLLAHVWTLNRSRIERKSFRATDHFHATEAVLARELARLKSLPWDRRWYAGGPGNETGVHGEFDYVLHVQDVADHWEDPARDLDDHTDLFLRMTHSRNTTEITTSCHFMRAVFFRPTPSRPTAFLLRKSVRTGLYDPTSVSDRTAILARIDQEERDREANRPVSNVHEYEIRDLHRAQPGLSMRDILANLDRAHMDGQIATQRTLLTSLEQGKRHLIDPALNATGQRYLDALTRFNSALTQANAQCAHVRTYSVARAQYALASAEWQMARTSPMCRPRCTAPACTRHTLLATADARMTTLMGETGPYPWVPDPVAGNSAPVRFEAPHAYVMAAFLRATREDPADALNWAAAIGEAQILLRGLRDRYPRFHLWGEDAVTGERRGGAAPLVADELTWYLERLLSPPVLAVGGSFSAGAPAEPRLSRRVFRWCPTALLSAEPGEWIEEATLEGARTAATVVGIEASGAGSGRFMGGRLLVVGGRGPDGLRAGPDAEIYDPFTRSVHPVRAPLDRGRAMGAGVRLAGTGEILLVGGHDPAAGPGTPVIGTESFDPASETFVTDPAWALQLPHPHPRAAQLPDGRVLSVDGTSGQTFDCASPPCAWTSVSNAPAAPRDFATLTVLASGDALVAGGGVQTVTVTSSCDVYVATTTPPRFFPTGSAQPAEPVTVGSLFDPRYHAWAVPVDSGPDQGKVLIGNGVSSPAAGAPGSTGLELYDPVAGTSVPLQSAGNPVLTGGAGAGRRAAGLGGNNVLITGGRPSGGGSDNVTEVLRFVPGASQLLPQPPLPDGLDEVELVVVR